MKTNMEPNPSYRRNEDFPKTTTLPEGWNSDALMAAYNPPASEPVSGTNGSGCVECSRPSPQVDENLFTRRLDPFPKPNTIPNGWDMSEWYL